MRPIAAGIAVGIAVLGLTRFIGTLLFGVEPADPLTDTTVALVLAGVVLPVGSPRAAPR